MNITNPGHTSSKQTLVPTFLSSYEWPLFPSFGSSTSRSSRWASLNITNKKVEHTPLFGVSRQLSSIHHEACRTNTTQKHFLSVQFHPSSPPAKKMTKKKTSFYPPNQYSLYLHPTEYFSGVDKKNKLPFAVFRSTAASKTLFPDDWGSTLNCCMPPCRPWETQTKQEWRGKKGHSNLLGNKT